MQSHDFVINQSRYFVVFNDASCDCVLSQQRDDTRTKRHHMTKQRTQSKRNTRIVETPTIALKTIHDDIMRDNKNATITTKKMRVKLRASMRDVHEHNASWMFTQTQYDVIRSMFDPSYATRIAKRAKRDTSTNARKTRTQSNDAPIVVDNDADANVIA